MATFLEISRLVTGFPDIGDQLSTAFENCMTSRPEWREELAALSRAADEALRAADREQALMRSINEEPKVAAAARRLAHLWYAGRLPPENKNQSSFVNEDAYFSALLWRAARAHAPGLSGGYTGHWRYAPDG